MAFRRVSSFFSAARADFFKTAEEHSGSACASALFSFAPPGLSILRSLSHGSRRGLHSFAPSELGPGEGLVTAALSELGHRVGLTPAASSRLGRDGAGDALGAESL